MIEIKSRVHDRYSIEFKMGFVAGGQPQESDFTMGMWIFVPSSLDITPATFTNAEFYRCLKSNIRLITPDFDLYDIVGNDGVPFRNVLEAGPEDYEYLLKLFCAIVKSAVRDERDHILESAESEREGLCRRFTAETARILKAFDALPSNDSHSYCGEFLCNIIRQYAFPLMSDAACRKPVADLLRTIDAFCESHGYAYVKSDAPDGNSLFIHRRGVLKKYVESIMFLRVPKKRDGIIAEQAYYSLAAGMAMIFATVVAWAFQRRFGNLTWPLFIALIISYMLKDRIKEMMRYFFAHRIGDRHFDNKARMSIRGHKIGSIKEAMDFIPLSKVPGEIDRIRNGFHLFAAENRFTDEKVILYKKQVRLDRKELERFSIYHSDGINDIIRLQVRPFLRKMDDPHVDISVLDKDGGVGVVPCDKDYFINIILQYSYGGTTEYKRFRLALNRDGIKSMDEIV